jgi:hypothetical protein
LLCPFFAKHFAVSLVFVGDSYIHNGHFFVLALLGMFCDGPVLGKVRFADDQLITSLSLRFHLGNFDCGLPLLPVLPC